MSTAPVANAVPNDSAKLSVSIVSTYHHSPDTRAGDIRANDVWKNGVDTGATSFAPSSITTGVSVCAAAAITRLPVSVLPMKAIMERRGGTQRGDRGAEDDARRDHAHGAAHDRHQLRGRPREAHLHRDGIGELHEHDAAGEPPHVVPEIGQGHLHLSVLRLRL